MSEKSQVVATKVCACIRHATDEACGAVTPNLVTRRRIHSRSLFSVKSPLREGTRSNQYKNKRRLIFLPSYANLINEASIIALGRRPYVNMRSGNAERDRSCEEGAILGLRIRSAAVPGRTAHHEGHCYPISCGRTDSAIYSSIVPTCCRRLIGVDHCRSSLY